MASADGALAQRNKALVREFYTTVLINRQVNAAPQFLRADYIRHDPNVPSGLKGFNGCISRAIRPKASARLQVRVAKRCWRKRLGCYFYASDLASRDGQHKQALGFDMFRVQGARL
jgi:predicted SnoaL-like aldol condensation-catalyzing enzyme